MRDNRSRQLVALTLLLGALLLQSCSNRPPQLQPVAPQTFSVGVPGQVEFRAYDPDGDPLSWYWDIPGLVDIRNRADLANFVDRAIFTFTPLAKDVGQFQLDVSVSDGTSLDLQSVPVTIRPGSPREGQPKFIRPLGPGVPFNVNQSPCIDVDVVVEDVDSLNVAIRQEPPILGSQLNQQAPKAATFHWCPTEEQKYTTRYVLQLVADDGDNPPVVINEGAGYYILLERN